MSSTPSTENLPKGDLRVRYLVAAGEGKLLVGADLDQIEMRVLAHYAAGGKHPSRPSRMATSITRWPTPWGSAVTRPRP